MAPGQNMPDEVYRDKESLAFTLRKPTAEAGVAEQCSWHGSRS